MPNIFEIKTDRIRANLIILSLDEVANQTKSHAYRVFVWNVKTAGVLTRKRCVIWLSAVGLK